MGFPPCSIRTTTICLRAFPSISISKHDTLKIKRTVCLISFHLQHHKLLKLNQARGYTNGFLRIYGSIRKSPESEHQYGLVRNEEHGGVRSSSLVELPGGKRVVELVAAWNDLTDRMTSAISSKSSELLLKSLKISIPLLQSLPCGEDGRSPLSRALSVACILADLQVEAGAIAVGILREVVETGAISWHEIKMQLGSEVTHLLHDCFRVKKMPKRVDILDDDNAYALRKFCLAYYDIRAVVVELAVLLDMMRHLNHLPKYLQQTLALEVMQVYAPLAHAIGTGSLSLELEDLAFQYLFPSSYPFVDAWLKNHGIRGKSVLDECRCQLLEILQKDSELRSMVDDISVQGRYKSRFSTMKKLLKDGRKQEEVYDVLGLRVVLNPRTANDVPEVGRKACYRTRELIQSLWKEIPKRTKDYIAKPKENGYESLHLTIDLSDITSECPFMEVQIRTAEMDSMAAGGAASHELYKGGLTDPEQVKQLKAIMLAAADLAAFHFQDHFKGITKGPILYNDKRSQVFKFFDKNEDGLISMEELKEVMEELGADKEDAHELMHLVDANSDGSLSSDEFAEFQRQVRTLQNLEGIDEQCSKQLDRKFLGLQTDQTGRGLNLLPGASSGNTSRLGTNVKSCTIVEKHEPDRPFEELIAPSSEGDIENDWMSTDETSSVYAQ